jgi:hypothetical protein
VLLIFRDEGLDVGEFPDLMAQRLGIGSGECSAATSACAGHAWHDLSTLFGRDQVAFVFGMAGLTARAAPRFGLGARWLGVWVGARRRFRGVGRIFARLGFQFGNAGFEDGDLGLERGEPSKHRRLRGRGNRVPQILGNQWRSYHDR